MTGGPDDAAFLRELQVQCARDGAEHAQACQQALATLGTDAAAALVRMLQELHSLKGNLQAVGHRFCGEFVHAIESSLVGVQALVRDAGGKLAETDAQILEFLIGDALQGLEGYLADLVTAAADAEAMAASRKPSLTLLAGWKPEASPAAAPPAPAPASTVAPAAPAAPASASVAAPSGTPDISAADFFSPASAGAPAETRAATGAPGAQAQAVEPSPVGPRPVENPSEKAPEARVAASKKDEERIFLLCRNGDRKFIIPIQRVVEVVQARPWSPLPSPKREILGLLTLRGEVLPILNLASVLGRSRALEGKSGYLVVCRTAGGSRFAFPMEEAEQVIELGAEAFRQVGAGSGPGARRAGKIGESTEASAMRSSRLALLEDQVLVVLDLDAELGLESAVAA